ncbi:MAG: hypothetical protein D6753_00305 [Planctomycetota bacterium]|nr:MAG: hypothetical protein D6753_00305 [Planctomycetota bacterium]
MAGFLKRYVRALLAVAALMGIYRFTVVPWLQTTAPAPQLPPDVLQDLNAHQSWDAIFPEGSWQRRNPKLILTHRGVLLAQRWQQIDPQTWQLQPLTIVLPVTAAGRQALASRRFESLAHEDLWIITAGSGAQIHFDEPLDITSGRVPQVVQGTLGGAIELSRRTSAGQPQWRIRTHDLVIDDGQLSTPNEVLIEWNNSRVVGRELRLTVHNTELATGNSRSAWGPLDQLDLYKIESVDIALPPGGLWGRLMTTAKAARDAPARLKLAAGGRFSFDFNSSTARLRNGVHVEHTVEGVATDVFDCQTLVAQIEPRTGAGKANGSQRGAGVGSLGIRRIEATGSANVSGMEAFERVTVTAPSIGARLVAKRVVLDLIKRRVDIDGSLLNDAGQQPAELVYQTHRIQAPRIEYQAAPESAPGQPAHLGWLVASGAGTIDSQTEAAGNTSLRWTQSLRMAPLDDGARQWIEVLGQASASQRTEQGNRNLLGERIELWLSPAPPRRAPPAAARLVASQPPPATQPLGTAQAETVSPKRNYRLQRLLVTGDAMLNTPQANVRVDSLELRAEYPAPIAASATPTASASPAGASAITPPTVGSAVRVAPVASEPAAFEQPVEPLMLTGKTLVATVIGVNDGYELQTMHMEGPVRAWRESVDPFSWHLEGTSIDVLAVPVGGLEGIIHGQPARVVYGDGFIASTAIRYVHATQAITIDQPGELLVPSALLHRPAASTGAESPVRLEWLKQPRVLWHGGLSFQDQRIRITDRVVLSAAFRTSPERLTWLEQECDDLQIDLTGPVTASALNAPAVQLQQVTLRENLRIMASTLSRHGDRVRRDLLIAPECRYEAAQSQVVVSGPGTIKSWFRDDSNPAPDAPRVLRGANVRYRDTLVALVDRREVVLEGNVEILTGPVADWEQDIEFAAARGLRTNDLLVRGDQVHLYDVSTAAPLGLSGQPERSRWECKVAGHVAFRGRTETSLFSGTAQQIVYNTELQRLILRGAGREPAYLRSDPVAGGRPFQAYVESAAVNPATGEIQDLRIAAGGIQVGNETGGGANGTGQVPALPGPTRPPDPRRDFFDTNRGQP